ncbi:hypothetical protein KAR91_85385 [Candidatus Pacearchaeota archaeon]|nr:hypothetical protein [Candidatus Pacearchaeota archaeon]
MAFTKTFDTATPAGSDDPAEADDRMREIKAATQERENVDHYWPLTGTEVSDADAGEHRKVLFHAPIPATPTVAANHGDLRIKDVANGTDTKAELVFTNEAEAELQLSSNGKNLANNVSLTADNAAGDGAISLIKADTNDKAVVPDGTQNLTNAAPDEDKDLANKKYVDDQIAAGIAAGAGVAKGMATFDGEGGITEKHYVNVTRVDRNGVGKYTVVWETGFTSANYTVVATGKNPAANNGNICWVNSQQTGSTTIWCTDQGGTLADCDWISVVAYGVQ